MVQQFYDISQTEFTAGTILTPFDGKIPSKLGIRQNAANIKFPTRLNAMPIDRSAFLPDGSFIRPVGEIMVSLNKFVKVNTVCIGEKGGILKTSDGTKRKGLVNHSYQIMCKALKESPSLFIEVNDEEVPWHSGFGSTGATLGAVCASINELYGNPLKNQDLIKYVMGNYGEQKENTDDKLLFVVSIGGSTATGLTKGGVVVLAGEGVPIGSMDYHGKVVLGIPNDYIIQTAEEQHIERMGPPKFNREKAEEESRRTAYTLLNKGLPKLVRGDISGISDQVFDNRFNGKGISRCAPIFPRVVEIGQGVKSLYEDGHCDMLGMSSVGPAFFALVDNERDQQKCVERFQGQNMRTEITTVCNSTYQREG